MPPTRNSDFELKIDNLLCYAFGAKCTLTNEIIKDVIKTTYSIDDVKISKDILGNLLNNVLPTRKEPDKKNKEINDLFSLVDDFLNTDENNAPKVKFVCDNYRKIPPMGMEQVAPMLLSLIDEVQEINKILPHCKDINSEVRNSADTIRSLMIEISELKDLVRTQSQNTDNTMFNRSLMIEINDLKQLVTRSMNQKNQGWGTNQNQNNNKNSQDNNNANQHTQDFNNIYAEQNQDSNNNLKNNYNSKNDQSRYIPI